MTTRPRRSVLYMPGDNERALSKARELPVDALIFDLEDAVAPSSKVAARDAVGRAIAFGGYGNRERVVRINALDTEWGGDDFAAAVSAGADAVLVPKIDNAADLDRAEALMVAARRDVQLWIMIETPLSIMNLREIVSGRVGGTGRLSVLVMGTNDLAKATRIRLDADRSGAIFWLSAAVTAARAAGLDVLDGVYNTISDVEGFAHECVQGRRLGFDGKTLIHPAQIEAANRIFAPDTDDVAWARKVVAAFEAPEADHKGVICVDGEMVERLHVDIARRLLQLSDAITVMERGG